MSEEKVKPKEPTVLEEWAKRFDWGVVRHYRDQIARSDWNGVAGYGIKVKQHPPGPGTTQGWDRENGPFNNPDRK